MKISDIAVAYLGGYGSDLTVVNAARVSFHKESEEFREGDEKLINYLAKHKHFSPFNHAFLSFRVKAPITVARQMVKHKFLPWNEVSRRYVDEEPEFYFPDYFRSRSESVKQGSSESPSDYSREEAMTYTRKCLAEYLYRLSSGGAPEQARDCLPQNMMTEWWWSGTLGAFLDMLVLRLDPHTQKESRDVAQLIATHVQQLFPVSYKARIES